MAQTSSLSLDNSLQAASLADPGQPFRVYDRSGGKAKLLYWLSLVTLSNAKEFGYGNVYSMGSRPGQDGKFQTAVLDPNYVTGVVATRTVSGSNLILTFTDPTITGFRVKDVVSNDVTLNRKGRVIASSPGQIEIEPWEQTATGGFVSADFAANTFLRVNYDTSGNEYSAGKTFIDQVPNLQYNYVSTTRDSSGASMRQDIKSFIRWDDETGMWYDGRLDRMFDKAFFEIQNKLLYSDRAQNISTIEGKADSNGGLNWCLDNRGGFVLPISSPLTQQTFENFLTEIRSRKTGGTTRRRALVMGYAAYQRVSGFYQDYIKFSGTFNTYGGADVIGKSIPIVSILREEYDLIILDFLDDRLYSPTYSTITGMTNTRVRSNDIYLLDMDPIASGDNMGSLSPIRLIHWGDPGSSPFHFGYLRGMGTEASQMSNSQLAAALRASQNQVMTDIEGWSAHLLTMMGQDMPVGDFSGRIYATN